jgi:hypothetical protein
MAPPNHHPFGAKSGAVAACLFALLFFEALSWHRIERLRATVQGMKAMVDTLEAERADERTPRPVSPLLLDYQLDVPGRGEVFPAMVASEAPEYWPVAVLRVTNTASSAVLQIVSSEIPGWSRRTEQTAVVPPREERQIRLVPDLLPRAYANHESRTAVLEVRVAGSDGTVFLSDRRPVLIHPGSEIYWGRKFANAQLAARWVTPHDRSVLELVSEARRYIRNGRMAGYSSATGSPGAVASHVRAQARAIYRAMQRSGISYVSSRFVMGDYVGQAQRLRLPRETLGLRSANCIDVSLAFASAIENLDMQPILVIVPGHAFTGVRLGRGAQEVLHLDLTTLPDGSFDAAVRRARDWLRKTPAEKVIVVDVAAARVLGVYPLVADDPGGTLSAFRPAPRGGR